MLWYTLNRRDVRCNVIVHGRGLSRILLQHRKACIVRLLYERLASKIVVQFSLVSSRSAVDIEAMVTVWFNLAQISQLNSLEPIFFCINLASIFMQNYLLPNYKLWIRALLLLLVVFLYLAPFFVSNRNTLL